MTDKTMFLETYDPKWEEKFDRIMPRVRELNEKTWLTNAEAAEHRNLAALLCTICDAGLKTPQDYLQRHLYHAMLDAERLDLTIAWPDVPPDADIDTVRAAVARVYRYLDRVKRDRDMAEHPEHAFALDAPPPPPSPCARPGRWWAMFSRLGRCDRRGPRGSV